MKTYFYLCPSIRLPYPYRPVLAEEGGQLYVGIELRHNGIEDIDWDEARAMLCSCWEQLCEYDVRSVREVVGMGIRLRLMCPPYLCQWVPIAPD